MNLSFLWCFVLSVSIFVDRGAQREGRNDWGQLGQGDYVNRGANSTTLGDNLAAIDLGTAPGGTGAAVAVAVTTGDQFTCVLVDGGAVKVHIDVSLLCVFYVCVLLCVCVLCVCALCVCCVCVVLCCVWLCAESGIRLRRASTNAVDIPPPPRTTPHPPLNKNAFIFFENRYRILTTARDTGSGSTEYSGVYFLY